MAEKFPKKFNLSRTKCRSVPSYFQSPRGKYARGGLISLRNFESSLLCARAPVSLEFHNIPTLSADGVLVLIIHLTAPTDSSQDFTMSRTSKLHEARCHIDVVWLSNTSPSTFHPPLIISLILLFTPPARSPTVFTQSYLSIYTLVRLPDSSLIFHHFCLINLSHRSAQQNWLPSWSRRTEKKKKKTFLFEKYLWFFDMETLKTRLTLN